MYIYNIENLKNIEINMRMREHGNQETQRSID